MSKDQAARIVERARETVNDGEPVWSRETIAKDIRRAIASAVRKERERCVKCACKEFGFVHHKTLDAIIKEINAPTKKRTGKRKGKR